MSRSFGMARRPTGMPVEFGQRTSEFDGDRSGLPSGLAINRRSGRLNHGADRLPPLAQQRFAALVARAEAANDHWRGAFARYDEVRAHWGACRAQTEDLQSQIGHTFSPQQAAEQMKELREQEAMTHRELVLREAAETVAGNALNSARAVVEVGRRYLESLPSDVVLTDAPMPAVKLKGDPQQQLAAARAAIDSLRAEQAAVRSAPPADVDTIAAIRASVSEMARGGRPLIADGKIMWPREMCEVTARQELPVASINAGLPFLAWLDPERLVQRLHEEALRTMKESGQQPGMPAVQRRAAVAAMAEKILEAEFAEEAVIRAIEAQGGIVTHREDADPRAVLSITGPAPSN